MKSVKVFCEIHWKHVTECVHVCVCTRTCVRTILIIDVQCEDNFTPVCHIVYNLPVGPHLYTCLSLSPVCLSGGWSFRTESQSFLWPTADLMDDVLFLQHRSSELFHTCRMPGALWGLCSVISPQLSTPFDLWGEPHILDIELPDPQTRDGVSDTAVFRTASTGTGSGFAPLLPLQPPEPQSHCMIRGTFHVHGL